MKFLREIALFMVVLLALTASAQESQSDDDMPPPPPPPSIEEVEMPEDASEIFMIVEDMPSFPCGETKMMEFIANNLEYPADARENNIQGRVLIQFMVDETGKVRNVKVLRGVHPSLDSAAVKVVQSMPNWKPGKHRGKPVKVRYVLPIRFVLEGDVPKKKRRK